MQSGGTRIKMQFLLVYSSMIDDGYGWEILLNKSLSHSVIDFTSNGHPSACYFCGQATGYTTNNIHRNQ